MKKLAFLSIFLLFSINTYAELTMIKPGIELYSEYYPNPSAKFKGTIIFENGSGTRLSEWKKNKTFFNCVKNVGSIFLYDRTGLGKSLPDSSLSSQNPLTPKRVNEYLVTFLQQKQIKPPYIFVAHSYGALYAGYFALKNPSLVKGLLLVDPVPRDFHFRAELTKKYKIGMAEAKIKPVTDIYKKYGGSKAEVIYQLLGLEETKESLRQLGSINNTIPIAILSSTEAEEKHPLAEDWYNSQKQWLNSHPKSNIIKITSGHFIQISKPKEVCQALKNLTDLVREN